MRFSTGAMSALSKAKRNRFSLGSSLIVLAMGILFITVSVFMFADELRSRDWPSTQGKVVHVAERLDAEDGMMYTPTVEYKVNGTSYRVTSSASSSGRESVGSTKTVRYNPSNPGDGVFNTQSNILILILFPLFGIVMIVGSITASIQSYKRSQVIKRLKQSGTKVQGIVTNVESGSQRGSVRVTVSAPDQTGQVRSFSSDTISGNTFTLLTYQESPIPMDVYIDTANPDDYYVDLDDIPVMTVDSVKQLLQKATSQAPFGNTPTMSAVQTQPTPQSPIATPSIGAAPAIPPAPSILPVDTADTAVPPAQNYR